ncbi:MAG: hypothetical protein WBD99_02070 [Thermodesulfobacteriota bacterium]
MRRIIPRLLLFSLATVLFLVLILFYCKKHGSLPKTAFTGKDQATPKIGECRCPTLDELLVNELSENPIKLEIPPEKNQPVGSEESIKISEEKDRGMHGYENNGIRIVLRYEDGATLLTRAEQYGLTNNRDNTSVEVPYFILNGNGKRLYFSNGSSFKRFLNDIGGKEIFQKAKKEIVVGLASGRRFELIEYK